MTKTNNPSGCVCVEEGEEKFLFRIVMKERREWDLFIPLLILILCAVLLLLVFSTHRSLTHYDLYEFTWFIFCLSTFCMTLEAWDLFCFVLSCIHGIGMVPST